MFLIKRTEGKFVKIAVVGMGKIGLPLAAQYASKGHTVIGVDVNPETVRTINCSEEPFLGEFGLAEALRAHVPTGLLRASTSYEEAIPNADVVVVVVPLFVDEDNQPDFGWMDAATNSIGKNLSSGTLVIYETTLPIGTTRNRWKPMLEELSGLTEGSDFHLVFSPERVLTGRVFEDLKKYPKLIGGLSKDGSDLAREFYNAVLDFDHRNDLDKPNGVWDLSSAEAAEMAKLAETTYRDVNIALVNQFAKHAEEVGVDIYQVIEACNSQPFSHLHTPGISVGGHCIPVYPWLFLSSTTEAGVVGEARRLNDLQPSISVQRIHSELGKLDGVNILILGISYREGVAETHKSGAFSLQDNLRKNGANVFAHDYLFTSNEIRNLGFRPFEEHESGGVEVIILHTWHPQFEEWKPESFPSLRLVYDGRNRFNAETWELPRLINIGVGTTRERR